MSTVRRLDSGTLRQAQLQPNGWLRVDGYLTRTGVFTYGMPDGTKRREYRPPDEVFKADSLGTFELVPVTDQHPPEFLNAKNTAQHTKGAVSAPRRDGSKVLATFLITDAALIEKMQAGQQQVSCGYVCDLEDAQGVTPEGERYDAIQRNIRGNHVAIVPVGRAGSEVRVRMDAAELEAPSPAEQEQNQMAHQIRIDGLTFEVTSEQTKQAFEKFERDQAKALELARKDAADQKATAEKLQAKLDEATESLKKKDAEIAELPAKMRADAAARAELETKARKVLGAEAKLDGLDTKAVQLAVLAKLKPEAKFDGKSDAYIEARFDAAIDGAASDGTRFDANAGKLEGTDRSRNDAAPGSAEKARDEFMKASQNAWKAKTTAA